MISMIVSGGSSQRLLFLKSRTFKEEGRLLTISMIVSGGSFRRPFHDK